MSDAAKHTLDALLSALEARSNAEDAVAMAAYMRNLFPFFGIRSTERKALLKKANRTANWEDLVWLVETLYAQPQREAHYAALDLLERHSRIWTPEIIPLMERLVLTKSWWDTVDRLASPLMAKALEKFPQHLDRPNQWIAHESFWLQRVALLYQLKARESTDCGRLASYIEKTMLSQEFFLRKAIGWALRQYGYTNPEWVRDFVGRHRQSLSPLSIREGTRALPPQVPGSGAATGQRLPSLLP